MVAMIVIGFIIGLFIMLGIMFMNGKGLSLIAGYNTMPKEEKDKYDTMALSKFMGKMMFAFSFSMVFWLIGEVYSRNGFFNFGLALFIAIIVFTIVYLNTGNRFKNDNEGRDKDLN